MFRIFLSRFSKERISLTAKAKEVNEIWRQSQLEYHMLGFEDGFRSIWSGSNIEHGMSNAEVLYSFDIHYSLFGVLRFSFF
jgi:hypothetical protein